MALIRLWKLDVKKKEKRRKKDIRNHGISGFSLSIEPRITREREKESVLGVLISHDRKNAISRPPFFFPPLPPSHRTWLNRWFNRGRSRDSFSVFRRTECTHIEREREREGGGNLSKLYFRVKRGGFRFPARWPGMKKCKRAIFIFYIDNRATRDI